MKNYSFMVFPTTYSERLNNIFQCQNWETNLNIQVLFLPFDKGFHFFLAEHCSADILLRSSELLAQVIKVKDKLKIFTSLFPLHIHQTFKYFLKTLRIFWEVILPSPMLLLPYEISSPSTQIQH